LLDPVHDRSLLHHASAHGKHHIGIFFLDRLITSEITEKAIFGFSRTLQVLITTTSHEKHATFAESPFCLKFR
jgi:hypothetical protein